jgi:transposase-like protein
MSVPLKEIMQSHIEKWHNSGMSKVAYADKIGISRHKFEYWVRKLSAPPKASPRQAFVELKPTEKSFKAKEGEKPSVQEPNLQFELVFANGTCLKIYV